MSRMKRMKKRRKLFLASLTITVTKVRPMSQQHQNLHQMMRVTAWHHKKSVKSHVMEELSKKQDMYRLRNISFTNETAELKDIEKT